MPLQRICFNCNKLVPQYKPCECKKERDKAISKEKNERYAEEKKFFNSARWKKLRLRIIERDGGYCQRCWFKFFLVVSSDLEVHHIKPRIKYPELRWEETNLVTLCKSCNTELGTIGKLDFVFESKEIEYDYYL